MQEKNRESNQKNAQKEPNEQKNQKNDRIRLTSSMTQRGQQRCYQTAAGRFVVARMPKWYPRFVIFRRRCFDHS